jgi:Flp pilus assembly protein TadG
MRTLINRIRQVRRDQRGMSFVFVGMGFMAFLAATTLAIDVGMFATARSQAQNAADAGALAGATALAFDDFDNRSASGPAVQNAITAAMANQVMGEAVSVTPEDVTFPNDPTGQPTRVQVNVYRTLERGNPVSTLMGTFFGVNTVNIEATATAEAAPANAMTCVKPFTIPDKWIEKQTPPFDGDDTYDAFDNKGRPLENPDVYIPADQPGYTGYNQEANRGQVLVIRAGTGDNIAQSFYFSLTMGGMEGGLTGAAAYEWNIANCNRTVYYWGDPLIQEPGNMVGPTIAGAEALIARDPTAYWNTATNKVVTSMNPSPRVFPIPLYDPPFYDAGKRNGRYADLRTANWIGFFLDRIQGNELWGRIIPIAGIRDRTMSAPGNLFPRAISLVK